VASVKPNQTTGHLGKRLSILFAWNKEFSTINSQTAVSLSAFLTADRPSPLLRGKVPHTFYVQLRNPMYTSGIKPATFRLVTWCPYQGEAAKVYYICFILYATAFFP
jgi:hypothetical protein